VAPSVPLVHQPGRRATRQQALEERAGRRQHRLLFHQHDAQAVAHHCTPVIKLDAAGDDIEQAGLAGAVAADQPKPLASGQGPLTTLIETVSSPQVDARISFLSASGEALPSTTLLRLPSSEDFLRGLQLPMSTASDRLRELLYPLHFELSWAQGTSAPTLIVRPTLLLSEEDKQSDELKALIAQLPALTTTWGGQSFAPFVRATNP